MPITVLPNGITQVQTQEAQDLMIKPALVHRNPFAVGGENNRLVKTVGGVHRYRPLHLTMPQDVLVPQSGCETWSPSAKSYVTGSSIECTYMEVNETLCGDEFTASCLHTLASKQKEIRDLMVNNAALTPITAALIITLQAAIGSSMYKYAWFADPNIGTGSYHSAASVDYSLNRTSADRTRFLTMMGLGSGIDTILRNLTGSGRVAYVDTNDGTLAGNATLATNINDFLVEMRLQSSDVLQYWHDYNPGMGMPAYYLQGGLWQAFMNYIKSLPGSSEHYRFILNGTPVPGAYEFDGYPVFRWTDPDMFDASIGLKGANGHSLNQRAMFTIPGVPTLVSNLNDPNNLETQGLMIQESPLIREKGRTDMYMSLGIGAGIVHRDLITYGYNSSTTYTTS